ncbi:amino acid ABC transporter permease [Oceanibaculum pacificum]|uniref:Amino acid ABC transporter permease n=1 Tax=Oceanibaculum pacificum TaxID=580166 RepID=A0A154W2A4_9PROT|nr:amino acid ABC transporter permease [Oceanibaculum pacificum]KZD07674.1 amino acid ABC transporter permease [Oceanibaculum pacificum]
MATDVKDEPQPVRPNIWNDARARAVFLQIIMVILVVAGFAYIADNAITNLRRLNISTGFGFLGTTASFDIGFTLISYSAASTYGRAFLVGLLNTLFISSIGVVLATILGFTVGVLRLSNNWLISKLMGAYVEIMRNIPLLLQIFFWYFVIINTVPGPRGSLALPLGVMLNNRGLYSPDPTFLPGFSATPIVLILAIIGSIILHRWSRKRQEATGQHFPSILTGLGMIVCLPVIAFLVTGKPVSWTFPELRGFNLQGGVQLPPEFVALLMALVIYSSAFIGEIVRAGILAVSKGQTEAAYSLGLKPSFTLRLVIIPQALRIIVPPLTSQYLNLTKNSSLAAAVGYPDLVHIFAGTTLNQTGQAIEIIFITMMVYLTISLSISAFMNWYNQRVALVER